MKRAANVHSQDRSRLRVAGRRPGMSAQLAGDYLRDEMRRGVEDVLVASSASRCIGHVCQTSTRPPAVGGMRPPRVSPPAASSEARGSQFRPAPGRHWNTISSQYAVPAP